MKKALKTITIGMLVLATIFMLTNIANSQTRFRGWLCDIFLCQQFTDLEAQILAMDLKLDDIQLTLQQTDTTNLAEKIDLILKSESSIWMQHRETIGDREFIDVYMKGETLREYQAFGLSLVYDNTGFTFIGITSGTLTDSWTTVDGNEATPGTVTIGGFGGAAQGIIGSTTGILFSMEIQRIAIGPTSLELRSFVDDITDLRPTPAFLTFE